MICFIDTTWAVPRTYTNRNERNIVFYPSVFEIGDFSCRTKAKRFPCKVQPFLQLNNANIRFLFNITLLS